MRRRSGSSTSITRSLHLGALEQIRLGATPYAEAQTQYGLGNQLLAYALTEAFGFSNHGFYAGVLLVDVVCIVVFFVIVQQILGLGWALAGLVGWVLWPSPAAIIDLAGWAVLTRWIAVPILALLLARLLLATGPLDTEPRAGSWIGPVSAGVIWGAGGFMSQENLSGGLLVLIFSLGLYGPVCGRPLKCLARFAGLFLGCGAAAFVLLIAGTIGIGHTLDVLRQAGAQSALVMAGVSNSVWSDNVGLTLSLGIVHGWWEDFAQDDRRGAARSADLRFCRPAHGRGQPAGGLSRPVMAHGERGTTAVCLQVRRRGGRRVCAASLRPAALRPLPSRRDRPISCRCC